MAKARRGKPAPKSDEERKVSSKGKVNSQDTRKFAGVTTNDPSWYVNNPVLARDVGNILFSRPTGAYIYPALSGARAEAKYDPGVMVLRTMLTWGGSDVLATTNASNAGTPLNLTATKLYQFVVHANSRNVSYNKKDLLMTMMAIDGVWQALSDGIRAYRLIAQYDVTNKYMSQLITDLGWNVTDLRSHVAQFRFYINYAITRINKFFVPDLFDIWKAHVSAYSNIYLDKPNSKAQYIARVPFGYWVYDDEVGDLNYLTNIEFGDDDYVDCTHGAGTMTMSNFARIVDLMISRIEDSEYIGIIQGDLLKAFGFEKMAQFNYVDIDMPIYPVYDEEFLYKLHNAVFWNASDTHILGVHDSKAVYRDTDIVDGNMQFLTVRGGDTGTSVFGTEYLDIPDGFEADPAKVLLMCLYKQMKQHEVTTKWRLTDTSTGNYNVCDAMPEMIWDARIYMDPEDSTKKLNIHSVIGVQLDTNGKATQEECMNLIRTLSILNKFDHVFAINTYTQKSGGVNRSAMPTWQIDNLAEISQDQLKNINLVIMWSLWSSSVIASSVGV